MDIDLPEGLQSVVCRPSGFRSRSDASLARGFRALFASFFVWGAHRRPFGSQQLQKAHDRLEKKKTRAHQAPSLSLFFTHSCIGFPLDLSHSLSLHRRTTRSHMLLARLQQVAPATRSTTTRGLTNMIAGLTGKKEKAADSTVDAAEPRPPHDLVLGE